MEEILTIVKEETGYNILDTDHNFVRKITDTFNQMLITDSGWSVPSTGIPRYTMLYFTIFHSYDCH